MKLIEKSIKGFKGKCWTCSKKNVHIYSISLDPEANYTWYGVSDFTLLVHGCCEECLLACLKKHIKVSKS